MLSGHIHPVDTMPHELSSDETIFVWERALTGVLKHGFSVRYENLAPPKTGTFNGLEIVLRPDNHLELQTFILLHLFGHSVQWVAPELAGSIEPITQNESLEEFLVALKHYEWEAAQLGLTLLHDEGVTQFDKWFSDFAVTDWRYVERYYREQRIPEWQECIDQANEPIVPRAIPRLEHRKVQVRFAF